MKEILYFILGAAVGAIFALLFTPQSGAELRMKNQNTVEKDWQEVQTEWLADQEKIHQRLNQIQQALQKQAAESEAALDA